jgi:hypothetical protein
MAQPQDWIFQNNITHHYARPEQINRGSLHRQKHDDDAEREPDVGESEP